jgi:hypothetical protein
MIRADRHVVGVALLIGRMLLALYGLFAVLYNGDGGNTYVTVAGREIDADLARAITLAIGLALLVAGVLILRRKSLFAGRS